MIATLAANPHVAELNTLLEESEQDCRVRESSAYASATRDLAGAPVVLFGAGGLGQKLTRLMREEGVEITAFADNNARLWGTAVCGIPVLAPDEAVRRYESSAIFVVSIWSAFASGTMEDRLDQLRAAGCRCAVPFHFYLWRRPEELPYFNVDLPSRALAQRDDVDACMNLWSSEASRREYVSQVRARLHADFRGIARAGNDRVYFPQDLIDFTGDDVYVDAGAFDGDSLCAFIEACGGRFKRAVAYEPDAANYAKLAATVDGTLAAHRHKISARNQAVSDRRGKVSLMAGLGMSSRIGVSETMIDAEPIDSLLDEGIHPTFLKYDVEGFELGALVGSTQIIAKLTPTLAVCVYHLQDHLWRLPLAVHRMNPNYNFHLRPYGFVWDEVCYAIPNSKARGE